MPDRLCFFDPPGAMLKKHYVAFWLAASTLIAGALELGRFTCGSYETYIGRMFLLVASAAIIPIALIRASRHQLALEILIDSGACERSARNQTRSIYLTPLSPRSNLLVLAVGGVGLYLMWHTPYPHASYCSTQIIFWTGMVGWFIEAILVGIAIKAMCRLLSISNTDINVGFYLSNRKTITTLQRLLGLFVLGGVALYVVQAVSFWLIGATDYLPVSLYLLLMAIFPIGIAAAGHAKIQSAIKHSIEFDLERLNPIINRCACEIDEGASIDQIEKLNALMSIQDKIIRASHIPAYGLSAPVLLSGLAGLGQLSFVVWRLVEAGTLAIPK